MYVLCIVLLFSNITLVYGMYCTLMLLPREVAVVARMLLYALSILSMQSMHATTLEYKK